MLRTYQLHILLQVYEWPSESFVQSNVELELHWRKQQQGWKR